MIVEKFNLLQKFFEDQKKRQFEIFIKPGIKSKLLFIIVSSMMLCPIMFLIILGMLRGKTYFACVDLIITITLIITISGCLFAELLGCHIIINGNYLEVVSKFFYREYINLTDITGYNESFSLLKNRYPNSLVVVSNNRKIYINLFCYSKNDINNLKTLLDEKIQSKL